MKAFTLLFCFVFVPFHSFVCCTTLGLLSWWFVRSLRFFFSSSFSFHLFPRLRFARFHFSSIWENHFARLRRRLCASNNGFSLHAVDQSFTDSGNAREKKTNARNFWNRKGETLEKQTTNCPRPAFFGFVFFDKESSLIPVHRNRPLFSS